MKISVCIDAVLPGPNPAEKVRALKGIGCGAFEFWSWWDKDLPALKQAMDDTGLICAAMCTRFFSLNVPEKRGEYIQGLKDSIKTAKSLGCKTLISQVGNDTGGCRDGQHASIVDGLKACAPILEEAGVTLVAEPLNTKIDHTGYYLWSSEEGFDIVREVASPNVMLLYDIYHQQIMEGNILNTITANLGLIGHMHVAGLPGRGELDLGELNYRYIFKKLDELGYSHYVGFEYFGAADPLASIREYL
jgi:hydroxypyruvate isomerase